jgi:NADPH:quinone reductase-like Zn-dependent oxidoreductase
MIKIFKEAGVELINIVRRKEQVETLEEMGCKYILNSTDDDFLDKLKVLCKQMKPKVCYEAIAGDMPGILAKALPTGCTIVLYGALSEKNLSDISPLDFMSKNLKIESFLLNHWLLQKNMLKIALIVKRARGLLGGTLSSTISKEFGLHEIHEAIEYYRANMTAGKVLLKPSLTIPPAEK